jgi:mono/diheme cytochrome c family protein
MKPLLTPLVALVATAGVAYVFVLPDFFSARAKPTTLEAAAVRRIRRLAIPRAVRIRANPIGLSTEVLADGRAHFADHCAVCHGNDGAEGPKWGRTSIPRSRT